MVLKSNLFRIGILVLLIAGVGIGIALTRVHVGNPTYTFINETSDHRFDESIMVSIKAATKRTGTENAIVILEKLPEGQDLLTFSNHLFQQLHVGERSQGRGILYVYVPKQHALRIEVAYALEGLLPDASLRMLEEAAKTFIYSDRDHDFWAELLITIGIRIEKNDAGESADFSGFRFLSGGAGRISTSYDVSREQLEKEIQNLPPGSTKYQASARNLNEAVQLYLESLSERIYDLNLGILDLDSKIFRLKTPMTAAQLQRNYRMMSDAGIFKIFEEGEFAFVFFKPGNPVLPLVFRKSQGGEWKIHEPLSWSLFHRFEDSKKVFLKFPLRSSNPEFGRFLQQNFGQPIFYFDSGVDISKMAEMNSGWQRDYFMLYDLQKLEPEVASLPIAMQLDLFTNRGQFSKFVEIYKKLFDARPQDPVIKTNYLFYKSELTFDSHEWRKTMDDGQ